MLVWRGSGGGGAPARMLRSHLHLRKSRHAPFAT
jgi:hypothetical protein